MFFFFRATLLDDCFTRFRLQSTFCHLLNVAGHSIMQPQSNADLIVLGRVRSAKINHRSVKKAFPIYRKAFWVARESIGLLQFFKNDQAPQAKGSVNASQIKSVSYGVDKQNKFFDLSVMLRGGFERRFRLVSREERDRWYEVLSGMAKQHSSQSQWHGILNVVHRRLAAASAAASYRFDVDLEGVNSGPHELMQYCVEAVDVGIDFTRLVAKTFAVSVKDTASLAGAAPAVPFSSVKLVLQTFAKSSAAADGQSAEVATALIRQLVKANTLYDPSSRQLTLSIILAEEGSNNGDVQFHHMSMHSVVSMLQSNVWRNPMIEGWLSRDPKTRSVLAQIQERMQCVTAAGGPSPQDGEPPATFSVSMQWGHGMEGVDEELLEDYLQTHVTGALLEIVLSALEELNREFPPASSSPPGAEGGMTTLQSASLLPSAAECFRRYLVGVAIRLDRDALEANARPAMDLLHRMWGDKTLNTSSIIVAKCRRTTGAPDSSMLRSLSSTFDTKPVFEQLRELVLTVRMSHAFNNGNATLSKTIGTRYGCHVNWESFAHSAFQLQPDLDAKQLPLLATCLTGHYADRLLRLARSLRATPCSGGSFFDQVFLRCISTIVLDFVCSVDYMRARPGAAAPSIRSGIFTDVMVLWPSIAAAQQQYAGVSEDSPDESSAARRTSVAFGGGGGAKLILSPPNGFVSVESFELEEASASTTRLSIAFTLCFPLLSPWMTGYFANPANMVPAPDRNAAAEDDDDGDTTSQEDEEGILQGLDFGNAIANERKIEAQVLNIHQVVNIVYDSQEGIDVQLKVSASVIQEAVDALQRVFEREGPISKHILIRILTSNLQRLRELFLLAISDGNIGCQSFGSTAANPSASKQGATTAANGVTGAESQQFHPDGPLDASLQSELANDANEASTVVYDVDARETVLGPLDRSSATELLRDYCEYVETESFIENSLSTVEGLRRTRTRAFPEAVSRAASPARMASRSRSQREGEAMPDEDGSGTGGVVVRSAPAVHVLSVRSSSDSDMAATQRSLQASANCSHGFDFESLATIALCVLLPNEARFATRSRRDVLWMGLENTGKSLLINSVHGVSHATHPTIGLTETIIAYEEWVLGCKELGGRVDFRRNWRQYMARVDEVHAIVFVVDVGRPSLYTEAAEYLDGVSRWPQFKKLPFLILFNNYRRDDRRSPKPSELYDALRLSAVEKHHPLQYCLCDVTVVHSANRSLHPDVKAGLHWICELLPKGTDGTLARPKHLR